MSLVRGDLDVRQPGRLARVQRLVERRVGRLEKAVDVVVDRSPEIAHGHGGAHGLRSPRFTIHGPYVFAPLRAVRIIDVP